MSIVQAQRLLAHIKGPLLAARLDDGAILMANQPFSKLVGYHQEDLVGQPTEILSDTNESVPKLELTLLRTPGSFQSVAMRTSSGASLRIDAKVWHLNVGLDTAVGVLALDGTELPLRLTETLTSKHLALSAAHEKLQLAYNQLELKTDILDQRNREQAALHAKLAHSSRLATLGELSAGLIHTVRNPLAAVSSALERLQRKLNNGGGTQEENLVLVNRAIRASERITGFLDGLQRLSPTARSGQSVSTSVADEVKLALEVLSRAHRPGITVETEVASNLRVATCSNDLHLILTNLIDNAVAAIGEEGLVRIGATRQQQSVVLEVSDSGSGVELGVLNHIFEPFVSTKAADQGSGLGLALVRAAVERNGGTVALVETGAAGATFRVELPAVELGGKK